jgi:hypothetical protein
VSGSGRIRPSAPVPTPKWGGKLVQDLAEVVEHQRVPLLPPPGPRHPVGQDDEAVGLLASGDDDPSELVVVHARHRTAPKGSICSRPAG